MNYKIVAILAAALLALTACEKKGPMEQAGEGIDNAVEDIQDNTSDAIEDMKDKANDVADEIEEGADEVSDKIDDAG